MVFVFVCDMDLSKKDVAFPKTEYQRCIVHQVRNTMKYVVDKDKKPFCVDL